MGELIFLNPVFKERLWGGDRLHTDYHYEVPSNHTGECWAISAHPEGDCVIANGALKGKHLSEAWMTHKELFGYPKEERFPLLVKLIDAKEDLSIQVHPDDAYARAHESGALGKTECWYILDCNQKTTIIVGHHAKNRKELEKAIEDGNILDFLNSRSIRKGDFLQIAPGTIHAIKAGTLLLETQQSSDVTYRLYDYNRLQDGRPRKLHVHKSLDVIAFPYKEVRCNRVVEESQEYTKESLISCSEYTVTRLLVHGTAKFHQEKPFLLCSVIGGRGKVDQYEVKKGDHFIIPYGYGTYEITGEIELIISNT